MDRRRRLTDYWTDALRDLRFTLRTLRRDAGFTVIAILILTLAIGSNVAVFSVLNTLLLRPLPFPEANQLLWIAPPPTKCGQSCATYLYCIAYDAFRKYTRSFQDVTGYFAFSSPGNISLNRGGAPIPATSIDVIANFFQVLGVQPAMGRAFRPEDAVDGAAPVILLSDAWWKTQFSRDPAIIGKTFDINGKQTTVIGVLPKSFDFGAVFSPGAKVDAITPLDLHGPPRDWGNIITMIGRMRPGVSIAQAQGDAADRRPAYVLEEHNSANLRFLRGQEKWNRGSCSRPSQGSRHRQVKPRVGRALVRGWSHPINRLCEFIQPAAGACCGPIKRVRVARCSGSKPRPDCGTASHRESGVVSRWRGGRARSGIPSGNVAGSSAGCRAASAHDAAH